MHLNSAGTGGIIQFGGHDWRVLDAADGKVLVISEKILFTREYGFDSCWDKCALNKYLNGQFYESSFSPQEKLMIAETKTLNKVYILNAEEVVRYFGDSGQLVKGNRYINDEYNQARIAKHIENDTPAWWWLRVPGSPDNLAMCVGDDGCIYLKEHGITVNKAGAGGVRPAFWINRA